MNKKKPFFIVLLFLLLGLTWYLFLKSEDYIIRFKAKTSPGTLFVSAEEWNLLNQKKELLKQPEITFAYFSHKKCI